MFIKTLALYLIIPKLLHKNIRMCIKIIVFLINGNDIKPLIMFDMQIELLLSFLSILFQPKMKIVYF